jgi:hypothetical protein
MQTTQLINRPTRIVDATIHPHRRLDSKTAA